MAIKRLVIRNFASKFICSKKLCFFFCPTLYFYYLCRAMWKSSLFAECEAAMKTHKLKK